MEIIELFTTVVIVICLAGFALCALICIVILLAFFYDDFIKKK